MTEAFDRLKTALKDRYTIERELGSCEMATVYLATDSSWQYEEDDSERPE